MIERHLKKILLCGFILGIALLLYHLGEFDHYYYKFQQEVGTSYGLSSLQSVQKYKSVKEMEEDEVEKERVFRFIDGTDEHLNLYSYHQDLLDSLNSEMTLCEKNKKDGSVLHCVSRKGPNKILDKYLNSVDGGICSIRSVRKINRMKIFFENFFHYRSEVRTFTVEYADMFCVNFVDIEVGKYDNYMVNRLLKILYDLKEELKDAW